MMVATLLLIGLTATLPSVYQEGRREQEAELIFRGTQYARAVALFHKQLNRYPTSTKELLQTNGIRFLRQEYRDPLDREGKWRFIHVNAAGVLIDSKNQPLAGNCGNPAGIGQATSTNSTFGGTLLVRVIFHGFDLDGRLFDGSIVVRHQLPRLFQFHEFARQHDRPQRFSRKLDRLVRFSIELVQFVWYESIRRILQPNRLQFVFLWELEWSSGRLHCRSCFHEQPRVHSNMEQAPSLR